MLNKIMEDSNELYGVYYIVYGSLAGEDELVKAYLWAGPYANFSAAVKKAQELRDSHQGDNCFVVRKY